MLVPAEAASVRRFGSVDNVIDQRYQHAAADDIAERYRNQVIHEAVPVHRGEIDADRRAGVAGEENAERY